MDVDAVVIMLSEAGTADRSSASGKAGALASARDSPGRNYYTIVIHVSWLC